MAAPNLPDRLPELNAQARVEADAGRRRQVTDNVASLAEMAYGSQRMHAVSEPVFRQKIYGTLYWALKDGARRAGEDQFKVAQMMWEEQKEQWINERLQWRREREAWDRERETVARDNRRQQRELVYQRDEAAAALEKKHSMVVMLRDRVKDLDSELALVTSEHKAREATMGKEHAEALTAERRKVQRVHREWGVAEGRRIEKRMRATEGIQDPKLAKRLS